MIAGKKILVTGGAGFIGCALAEKLAHEAERWVAVDSLHPQVHLSTERPASLPEAAEFVQADVVEDGWWDSLLADLQPDVIVHLAAETGTAQSLDEASRHSLANVVGTTRLTDALGRSGRLPERVILASSRAVYGEGRWQLPDGSIHYPGQRSHEQLERAEWDFPGATSLPSSSVTTEPRPANIYAATKLAQEHLLQSWGGSRGVPVTVLRLQNVYGPGQSLTNPYTGIVSLFSQIAERGDAIPVYEDGLITRDFVFIDDVASAIGATITREAPYAGPALDVGSGTGTTILQLAEAVAAYHGAPAPRVTGAYRDGDIRHAHCDVSLTRSELGWAPEWDVTRGVAELQAWIATREERTV